MKRLTIASIVAVFAMAIVATPSFAAISMSGQVATGFQQIESDSGSGTNTSQSLGFTDPAANLQVYGDVASGVDAYVELEQSDAAADDLSFDEAYITLDELLAVADVKVGQYAIDFGNQQNRRSDNADVQDNPLIGNTLTDPYAEQTGIEFSGSANQFAWSAGVTNGNTGNTANFGDSESLAFMGKIWGDFTPALSGAFSFYTSSHDQGSASTPGIVAGEQVYQGAQPGQVAVNGDNNEVTAWQLDAGYDLNAHDLPASIDLWYGTQEDAVSGGNDVEVGYYGFLGQFDINPQSHVALQYEVASDDSSNAGDNTEASKIQVGYGYNLNSNTLAKVEYFTQENDPNSPMGANTADEFSGFAGELSVSF